MARGNISSPLFGSEGGRGRRGVEIGAMQQEMLIWHKRKRRKEEEEPPGTRDIFPLLQGTGSYKNKKSNINKAC